MRSRPWTRRDFLCSAGAAATVPLASLSGATTPKPNILVIMADDMGFSDVGCYGSEIRTPHIDSLAAGGLRFTQFYNAARCCPTRAALLTGLYNHQAGVGNMIADQGQPSYRGFLNTQCVTIAEALKPAGYRTLMAGKWHVGEDRPHWPRDRGFDRYFGLISGAANYFRPEASRRMALDDQPWRPDSDAFYMTDAFTDHAVGFVSDHVREASGLPFFLYLAYTAPHWPLHALPEDIARYRGKYKGGWDALRESRFARQKELGLAEPSWKLSPRGAGIPAWSELTEAQRDDFDLRMSIYAAQIDRMDQGIGRVLDTLRRAGQFENTLILFLADNGGCHEEKIRGELPTPPGPADSFTSYGRPWANASNTPFRMYKHWVHEGGISSPLIAHWPAVLKKGGGYDRHPAHVTDLMATCLDVAGGSYPATYKESKIVPTEGQSLAPALRGRKRKIRQTIVWEHEGARAVRKGRWKLVAEHKGPWQLYDIEADRSELNDLSAREPGRMKELEGEYERWAARCGVVTPEQLKG